MWSSRLLIGAGALLLLAAGAWQGYVWLWNNHVHRVGGALISGQQHRDQAAASSGLNACSQQSSTSGTSSANAGSSAVAATSQLPAGSENGSSAATASSSGVQGLLAVPKIGLVAPVEQGVGDAQLSVAIGHIPASVWPGAVGTSILAAHDVSYFVHIDQLQAGDTIAYATPCTTYEFAVSTHQIVKQGSPVYNSAGPTLMLETCWPTNALWYTPDRLLVTATLTGTLPTSTQTWAKGGGTSPGAGSSRGSSGGSASGTAPPSVPAPKALAAEGLTLATNSIPMGTMTITGTPATTWTESPGPLSVESSGLQAFIGALKSAEQQQNAWWSALAPGVTMPATLAGAKVTDWRQGLDVSIAATGSDPTTVTLLSIATITGGPSPGTYALLVTEQISHGQLTVTGWHMAPYHG